MSTLAAVMALGSCRQRSQNFEAPQQTAQMTQQVQSSVDTERAQNCKKFVQDFYDWYFDLLNQQIVRKTEGPSTYDVLRLKPQTLTPSLRIMLEEDAKAQSKSSDEIVGLDFDPFINAQDWEGKYWVNSVTVEDGACRASVWGMDAGKKRDIVHPKLEITNGNWIFVDFYYPESTGRADASLMGILTDLRNERESTMDKKAPK